MKQVRNKHTKDVQLNAHLSFSCSYCLAVSCVLQNLAHVSCWFYSACMLFMVVHIEGKICGLGYAIKLRTHNMIKIIILL